MHVVIYVVYRESDAENITSFLCAGEAEDYIDASANPEDLFVDRIRLNGFQIAGEAE